MPRSVGLFITVGKYQLRSEESPQKLKYAVNIYALKNAQLCPNICEHNGYIRTISQNYHGVNMFALPDQTRGRSGLGALVANTRLGKVVMSLSWSESKNCVWVQRSEQTGVWRWSLATSARKFLLAISCFCRLFLVRCMLWRCGHVPAREKCKGKEQRYIYMYRLT